MGTPNEEVTKMEMVNAQFHTARPAACALAAPQLLLAGLRVDILRLLPIIIES